MVLNVSYSCASTFQDCEYKGCLRYFLKAQKDKDYIEPDYFKIGNAFHKVLELTMHDPDAFPSINFNGVLKSYGINEHEDGGRIMAMLRQYWSFHIQVPLDVIACEYKFSTAKTNGIIDAVMVERHNVNKFNLKGVPGAWWIVDLKTASKTDEKLPSRLHRDPQMCLYASIAQLVAEKYNLNINHFAGVRYREVTKPGQKAKAGESFAAWTTRCQASFREIVILKEDMDLKQSIETFKSVVNRIHEIESEMNSSGEIIARKNQKACLGYGNACEYFSVCNGGTFTEKLMSARITRIENGAIIDNKKMSDDLNNFNKELDLEEFK